MYRHCFQDRFVAMTLLSISNLVIRESPQTFYAHYRPTNNRMSDTALSELCSSVIQVAVQHRSSIGARLSEPSPCLPTYRDTLSWCRRVELKTQGKSFLYSRFQLPSSKCTALLSAKTNSTTYHARKERENSLTIVKIIYFFLYVFGSKTSSSLPSCLP